MLPSMSKLSNTLFEDTQHTGIEKLVNWVDEGFFLWQHGPHLMFALHDPATGEGHQVRPELARPSSTLSSPNVIHIMWGWGFGGVMKKTTCLLLHFDLVARSLTIYAWSQIWGYSRFQNLSPTHSWGSQHPRDSLEQPWGEFHGWHFPAGGFGAGAKGTLSWEGKTVVRKICSKSISLFELRIRSFQWACTLMWYKQYHSQPIGDGSEQSHFW